MQRCPEAAAGSRGRTLVGTMPGHTQLTRCCPARSSASALVRPSSAVLLTAYLRMGGEDGCSRPTRVGHEATAANVLCMHDHVGRLTSIAAAPSHMAMGGAGLKAV